MEKISICTIAKNEEKHVKSFLESIDRHFPRESYELIFTDTGSSDSTLSIVNEFQHQGMPVKLCAFEWCNDFAKAKNYCISQALSRFVLVLDCDEYVESISLKALEQFMRNNFSAVGQISRKNHDYINGRDSIYTDLTERFFDKNLYCFKGRIHEQVWPIKELNSQNEPGLPIVQLDIVVDHNSYNATGDELIKKVNRNNEILLEMIKEEPDNPYYYFQIGQSHNMLHDDENAACYYQKTLSLNPDLTLEYVHMAIIALGYCLLHLGQTSEACKLAKYENIFKNNAQYFNMIGSAYMGSGDLKSAMNSFLIATTLPEGEVEGANSFIPRFNLGLINEKLGNIDGALSLYRSCGDFPMALERINALESMHNSKNHKEAANINDSNYIKISVCTIMKNEEAMIVPFLENISETFNSYQLASNKTGSHSNSISSDGEPIPNALYEIVLLDTGSTDKTVDLAKEFINKANIPATIHLTKWDNNFAKAKNECISHAANDWILALDCDERITSIDLDLLQEMKSHENEVGMVTLINHFIAFTSIPATATAATSASGNSASGSSTSGSLASDSSASGSSVSGSSASSNSTSGNSVSDTSTSVEKCLLERFFNKKHFKYQYPVHEQLVPITDQDSLICNDGNFDKQAVDGDKQPGEKQAVDGDKQPGEKQAVNDQKSGNNQAYARIQIPITLDHLGYCKTPEEMKAKVERNNKILQNELVNNPDDPYLYFQLGQSYQSIQDYNNALINFQKGLEYDLDPALEYVQLMVIGYGYCLLELGDFKTALELSGVYEEFAVTADFVTLMGLIFLRNNMLEEALDQFEKALSIENYRVEGSNSFIPLYNIGCISEVLGNTDDAIDLYKQCGDFEPAKKRLQTLI